MSDLHRRTILAALAFTATPFARAVASEEPPTVLWDDLVPKTAGEGAFFETLKDLGVLRQGELSLPWVKQPPAEMVTTYNNQIVRIPGFVVPLTQDGLGVSEGLLVPYVGACIHVPPPPVNQIVFLRFREPIVQNGLWDPIWATGKFNTAAVETDLAEAGYVMVDAEMAPYEG
ncbi:MAG: DUF3299 domain-containing protein [Pseudomonadota bacterium]